MNLRDRKRIVNEACDCLRDKLMKNIERFPDVINALPCDDFFTVEDGVVTEKGNIDASKFVDHSNDFMEAMRIAMEILHKEGLK